MQGSLNIQESFTLKNLKFYIVSNPIKNVMSSHFIYLIIDGLFNLLPKSFIGISHNVLNNLYKLKRYDHSTLKVNKDYFENLTTINFYGIKMKIQKKARLFERYLGGNWRIPNSSWKRKNMGIISK